MKRYNNNLEFVSENGLGELYPEMSPLPNNSSACPVQDESELLTFDFHQYTSKLCGSTRSSRSETLNCKNIEKYEAFNPFKQM